MDYQGRSERETYLCPEADSLRTRPELVVRLLNPKRDLVLLRLFRKTNDQHPSLSRHSVLEQSTRPTNAGLARVAQLSILAEWDRGGGRRSEMDRKFEPARVQCSNLLVSQPLARWRGNVRIHSSLQLNPVGPAHLCD